MEDFNIDAEEQESKPVFDFRNDYYKIIRWELAMYAKYFITQDYPSCHRILRDLFSITQPFFKDDQRLKLREQLNTTRGQLYALQGMNYKDPVFAAMKQQQIMEVEDSLMAIKEVLLNHLKEYNMLLPMSAGSAGGFDVSRFMQESDL